MPSDIQDQMHELEELRLPELQARFAEIVGEPTRTPNKAYLLRRIPARGRAMLPSPTTINRGADRAPRRGPRLGAANRGSEAGRSHVFRFWRWVYAVDYLRRRRKYAKADWPRFSAACLVTTVIGVNLISGVMLVDALFGWGGRATRIATTSPLGWGLRPSQSTGATPEVGRPRN